ncbi:MAG: HAMP domain-containing histidine kinase [Thermoleophilia bacterium]|nr:HAMP domain-containing histidine kinase [Thermoleophilia bacterium]MDH5333519.1 HAMP domain-containing histidine kinase [Thermoleophilia bacterium]
MSFRARIALASAVAVAVAVVGMSAGAYVLVRNSLRDEVDRSLSQRSLRTELAPFGRRFDSIRPPAFGGAPGYLQLVAADGSTARPPGDDVPLPVDDEDLAIARDQAAARFTDVDVDGVHLRVLTRPIPGGALQLARPLEEVDASLSRLRVALLVAGAAGIALAALLGLVVSRAAIGPLRRLAAEAEAVGVTGDLTRRVGVEGTDEVGRLGHRFDEMLAALERSELARRQLVADASHELRTPIASVRTNVDLLARHPELSLPEREAALSSARSQLEELSLLVTDLVELARDGSEPPTHAEPFRIDEVVADAVRRAEVAHPGVRFAVTAEQSVVEGVAERAHRAVSNLLDNAAKWSPDGGTVEVSVHGPQVVVRDHGPGIDEEDLPHLFDRFYRSPAARSKPGSGLGLAIVKRVADEHGGTVTAENADGNGARFVLRLGPSG